MSNAASHAGQHAKPLNVKHGHSGLGPLEATRGWVAADAAAAPTGDDVERTDAAYAHSWGGAESSLHTGGAEGHCAIGADEEACCSSDRT